MNNKYLLMSLAAVGALVSCSEDEMFTEVAKPVQSAERVTVGKAVFTTDATRFNPLTGNFQVGDKFGAYLMDEYKCANDPWHGEFDHEQHDANKTEWKKQNIWWQMYNQVDYIHTNFAYELVKGEGDTYAWVNENAQLNEGNYVIGFPQQKLATNRRDLWYYIKPEVTLTKAENPNYEQFYYNVENEFQLGYVQIYRDEVVDPELEAFSKPLTLHPVLSRAKIVLYNGSSTDFKAQKVVIRANDWGPLPTIALVKPEMANNHEADRYSTPADHCHSLDDVQKNNYWQEPLFTQETARDLVYYIAPKTDNYVPYGCKDKNDAYEYVFNLPEEGGSLIPCNRDGGNGDQCVEAYYVALPEVVMNGNYRLEVYGEKYDPTVKAFRPGKFTTFWYNTDNKVFKLDNLDVWEEGHNIPTATLKFDDNSFVWETAYAVSTTEELFHCVKAKLSEADNHSDVNFVIRAYSEELVITDEILDYIKAWEEANNHVVTFEFRPATSPVIGDKNTHIVLDSEDMIDRCTFQSSYVDLAKDQHAELPVKGFTQLTVKKGVTLTADDYIKGDKVINNGVVIGTEVYSNVENNATGKLEAGYLETKLTNKGQAQVTVVNAVVNNSGTLYANELINSSEETTNTGTLYVENSIAANIVNKGTANMGGGLIEKLENTGTANIEGQTYIQALINKGKLNVNNNAMLAGVNDGTITLKEGVVVTPTADDAHEYFCADGNVYTTVKADLVNNKKGTIVVNDADLKFSTAADGLLTGDLLNDGIIDVNGKSHVYATGTQYSGIIDITDADKTAGYEAGSADTEMYFRTQVAPYEDFLKDVISATNVFVNPIIIELSETTQLKNGTVLDTDLSVYNIAKIKINAGVVTVRDNGEYANLKDQTVFPYMANYDYELGNTYCSLEVCSGATLQVTNWDELNVTATLSEPVKVNGTLRAENEAIVTGTVEVQGYGVVRSTAGTFEWTKSTTETAKHTKFAGDWSVL